MKITALILALVMVITAFAACAETAKSLGTGLVLDTALSIKRL